MIDLFDIPEATFLLNGLDELERKWNEERGGRNPIMEDTILGLKKKIAALQAPIIPPTPPATVPREEFEECLMALRQARSFHDRHHLSARNCSCHFNDVITAILSRHQKPDAKV